MTHAGRRFLLLPGRRQRGREEGKFFVWTPYEMERVSWGPGDAAILQSYYGVTYEGNFEGSNILHTPKERCGGRPGSRAYPRRS